MTSSILNKLFNILPVLACLASGTCQAAITPESVQTAREGNVTYFKLQLPLPDDIAQMSNRLSPFPLLQSNPPYAAPCYLDLNNAREWEMPEITNVFYGRTTSTAPLKLALQYPKAGGGWGMEEVNVSLEGAGSLTTRSVESESGRNMELTGPQQFARAQARIFHLLSEKISGDSGFFEFARWHTLKAADISSISVESRNANTFANRSFASDDKLYATATGARAIQETLQVDRAMGTALTTESRTLDISKLEGVQTKSHPFEEMLKGKTPKFSEMARLIPADQYMLRFTSPAKLQELGNLAEQWGASLLESPEISSKDSGMLSQVQSQLCLPSELLASKLGPAVVKEIAVTGSDPYFREGTDITVLFNTVSAEAFKAQADSYWESAAATVGADTATTRIAGIAVDKILTPGRRLSAYRTSLGNTIVYSNSAVAIARIIETKSRPDSSLASALDFQYMRSVWPQEESTEDGFLYLSDSFIRRLVGPESKIKEKRRIEAYGSMRSVLNGAMLHGYLNGPGRIPTLETLKSSGLLTDTDLAAPDGKVSWDPSNLIVSNSIYGTPAFMTPLCELPISQVSKSEFDGYTSFRDRYQEYWRRYFDPIGIRVKLDKTITLETYILPLIDESAYQELKNLTGDKPAKFDLSEVSSTTLVRWQVRLDPDSQHMRNARQMMGGMMGRDSALMEWVGEWATVWLEDADVSAHALGTIFESAVGDLEEPVVQGPERVSSFFELPIAAGIGVKSRLSLAAFLVALQGMTSTAAPDLVQFIPQDSYKGNTLVKIAPKSGGEIDRFLKTESSTSQTATSDVGLYYGTIGNGWYISTKDTVLHKLIDSIDTSATRSNIIEYNALLVASPANAIFTRPAIQKATSIQSRKIERDRLREEWLLYRCGLVASNEDMTSAVKTWLGTSTSLPSGGKISYDPATDQAVSSVYGPMRSMKPAGDVQAGNSLMQLFDQIAHVRAWLRFTEDGLMTHLELERK